MHVGICYVLFCKICRGWESEGKQLVRKIGTILESKVFENCWFMFGFVDEYLLSFVHTWMLFIRHLCGFWVKSLPHCSVWPMVFWARKSLLHWVWRGTEEGNIPLRLSNVADAAGLQRNSCLMDSAEPLTALLTKLHCVDEGMWDGLSGTQALLSRVIMSALEISVSSLLRVSWRLGMWLSQ